MHNTITINDQEYIIETGPGGYSYYRVTSTQRFGKKVRANGSSLLVWNGTDGTPNLDLGLSQATWGQGSEYAFKVDPDISGLTFNYESIDRLYIDDFFFGDSGNKLFTITTGTKDVREYLLATPYDLSQAATLNYTYGIYPELIGVGATPNGLTFNHNGTKLYHQDGGQNRIWQHTLSIPWDLSTVSFDTTSQYFDDNGSVSLFGHRWCNDGAKIVIGASVASDNIIRIYDVNTPWDITTLNSNSVIELDISSDLLDRPEGVYVGKAGFKLHVLDKDGYLIQYDLSIEYDISTASNKQVFDIREHPTTATHRSMNFNDDYTLFYTLGQSLDRINVWAVS